MFEFDLEDGSTVTIKKHGENIHITDGEDRLWMKISSNENNVEFNIYPQFIPETYIGKEAKSIDELKYNISCETIENALKCKCLLSDLIDCGYGQGYLSGQKVWLVALDIRDITQIFSSDVTLYKNITFDTKATLRDISEFCQKHNLREANTIFVCMYTCNLDEADEILKCFCKEVSIECDVWCQYLCIDTDIEDNSIHVFYN